MKQFFSIVVCFILCAMIIVSCKKDTTTPSSAHAISYKIVAADFSPFTAISYTNETDSLVRGPLSDSTSFFSADILIATVPYYAKVQASGFNNSGNDFNFTLQIFVDGAKVAEQPIAAPPHIAFDANTTYTIQ